MKAKLIAVAALTLFASAARATFPNNYASVMTATFNPNVGSAGTLYLSYQFTGTTQQSPMCNSGAHHYPSVGVQMYNNGASKSYHYSSGYQVAPCVQMNQTLTVAFDLGADQCNLSLLVDGTCNLAEEHDEVTCTIAGTFVFLLKKFQWEFANTNVIIDRSTRGWNGTYYFYDTVTNCFSNSGPGDNPPDWRGPDVLFDGLDFNSATDAGVRANEFCFRTQFIGGNFTGLPWTCFNTPRNGYLGYLQMKPVGFTPDVCTLADSGYKPYF